MSRSAADIIAGLSRQQVRDLRDWGMAYPGRDCGGCGADLGPSQTYPWHEADEDCRAIRPPVTLVASDA